MSATKNTNNDEETGSANDNGLTSIDNNKSLVEENEYLKNELNRVRREMEKYKSIKNNDEEEFRRVRKNNKRKMRKQKQLPSSLSSWMSNISSLIPFTSSSSPTQKYSPVSPVETKSVDDDDDDSTLFTTDTDIDAEYGDTMTNGASDTDDDDSDHNNSSNDGENNMDDDDEEKLRSTTYEEFDNMTFFSSLTDRTKWLVGLLVLQSMSSFIIANNEALLQHHPVIVQFLTMLVGAGGNAGNQAAVRVIRGLATNNLHRNNLISYIKKEFYTAILICFILGTAGFLRALAFKIPFKETIAITSSLLMIVMSSIIIGTALPLLMKVVSIDPAHSSTTIQVLMDILGVTLTVLMTQLLLGP